MPPGSSASSGDSPLRVVVVGGGVSGLTTALALQRRGYDVTVWTKDPLEGTTSHVAAALWYPYRAGPEERVAHWCLRSFPEFERIAQHHDSGVRLVEAVERLDESRSAPPPWAQALPHCELEPRQMRFTTAVIETPVYLRWLARRLECAGGRIEQRAVTSLDEGFERATLVVNAAGLGARQLASDDSVFPVRGQLLVVDRHGDDVRLHHGARDGFTYIVPRRGETILGGTARERETSLEPDEQERDDILQRAASLGLDARSIRSVRVGLRPCRPTVRLEVEPHPDGLLAHNYGHGGAGVTLSWGCALDLVDRIRSRLVAIEGPGYSKTMK